MDIGVLFGNDGKSKIGGKGQFRTGHRILAKQSVFFPGLQSSLGGRLGGARRTSDPTKIGGGVAVPNVPAGCPRKRALLEALRPRNGKSTQHPSAAHDGIETSPPSLSCIQECTTLYAV